MSFAAILMAFALFVSLGALVMTAINVPLIKRRPPTIAPSAGTRRLISVCIPARDEEANIADCVRSALAADLPEEITLEVLVYDDESTDRTSAIIDELIAADPRVRRAPTSPMPAGWSGKQWANAQLAAAARGDWLLFIDADVRLTPGALAITLAHAQGRDQLALLSCFPLQITGTLGERLLVPMIFFLLLSYLPIPRMRATRDPAASAGCGQFLFIRRDAYHDAGGHAAIRDSMHDGIKLTRNVRRAGYETDLFDGNAVAACRMYQGFAASWRGFAKNAYEGLGSPALLIFLTTMHALGHVLPWLYVALSAAFWRFDSIALPLAIAAVLVHIVHRSVLAIAFRGPWEGVVLHPVGVTLMTLVQWTSYVQHLLGRRSWRGRELTAPN